MVDSVVRYSNFYILSQLEKSVRMKALAFGNSNCFFVKRKLELTHFRETLS